VYDGTLGDRSCDEVGVEVGLGDRNALMADLPSVTPLCLMVLLLTVEVGVVVVCFTFENTDEPLIEVDDVMLLERLLTLSTAPKGRLGLVPGFARRGLLNLPTWFSFVRTSPSDCNDCILNGLLESEVERSALSLIARLSAAAAAAAAALTHHHSNSKQANKVL